MKEYLVEVVMSAWAKVIVIAQDEEEVVAKACNVVDLDDVYDWEIDAAEVEDDDEYTVEVEIWAWAKISVAARNGEEVIEAACDMIDLDDIYDWEIEGAEVV